MSTEFSNSTYSEHETLFGAAINDSSVSSNPELDCYMTMLEETYPDTGTYCNTTWDGLSCWPMTKSQSFASIPCFEVLNRVRYDTSQNATRECYENGTWSNWSDYSNCKPLVEVDKSLTDIWDVQEAGNIYYFGYGLSLIAVTLALWIFLYFTDLRCLRNTIHTNLMTTYLFTDLAWILTASLQSSTLPGAHKTACNLHIALTYLLGTNFFWMFVEGLYLYILVVKTFSVESVKWQIYALIGWGLPAVVILVWTLVKAYLTQVPSKGDLKCLWQLKDDYDFIFMVPILLVLSVNIFFLGQIMWVLITKLRAATSVESKQYRKAAKALLVLIPLLGITYIIVIATPPHRTARVIVSYATATLVSTQGFTVAVLYCFMNGEVRKSVRHHFEQWKDRRGLRSRAAGDYRNARNSDGAFRIYSGRGVRDRASCASLTTSGTWLSSNYKCQPLTSLKPVNGAYSPVPVRDETV